MLQTPTKQRTYRQNAQSRTPRFINEGIPLNFTKSLSRDVQVHMFPIKPASSFYDDSAILDQHCCQNYKIHRFTIGVHYTQWINFLQFEYLDLDTREVIMGRAMTSRTYSGVRKVFQFDEDEYPIAVYTMQGYIIDNIRFFTTKGRLVGFGGKGGKPHKYKLAEGLQVGAISANLSSYLDGFQFDCKRIPVNEKPLCPRIQSLFDKYMPDYQKPKKKPFPFFQSEQSFSFLIEYLTCKDVMKLFLVSKKVAQFRKTCGAYWIKCWNRCDKLMLTYLRGIAQLYHVRDLQHLLSNHPWFDIPLTFPGTQGDLIRRKLQIDFLTTNFCYGMTYLIVFAATYQTDWTATYPLTLLDDTTEIKHVYEKLDGFERSLQIRKISILVKWSPETQETLSRFKFMVKKTHIDNYAICTVSSVSSINDTFQEYQEGIMISASHRELLKHW